MFNICVSFVRPGKANKRHTRRIEWHMITTTELLAQLVAIDSRNPQLDAQGPGEAALAAAAAEYLRATGLDVTLIEPAPGRPSVIGRLHGVGGGPALLLNAHLDTVGFGAMATPI